MVVSYSLDIASVGLGTGMRLLCKWRGSIFKVMYKEAVIYFAVYAIISLIYRCGLTGYSAEVFVSFCLMCKNYMSAIPTTFILGFYVTIVFNRWNLFIVNLPFIDYLSETLTLIADKDKRSLLFRRHIVRYMLAVQVLVLRGISLQVRRRFPSLNHLVAAGILTQSELIKLQRAKDICENDTKYWLPCHWAIGIFTTARLEGKMKGEPLLSFCISQTLHFRKQCENLLIYDMINIPLVYTQIVSIAVWGYFAGALFGAQWLNLNTAGSGEPNIDAHIIETQATAGVEIDAHDTYLPVFTLIQFVCMVGWLRVAQNMLNPLGMKDDDFELNWLIDRNLLVGYQMADEFHLDFPELTDAPFETEAPPHTQASAQDLPETDMGPSCVDVNVPEEAWGPLPVEEVEGLRRRKSSVLAQMRSVSVVHHRPPSIPQEKTNETCITTETY